MLANAMAAVFVMYDPLVGHDVLIGDGLSKWVKLEVVVGAVPLARMDEDWCGDCMDDVIGYSVQ